MEKASATMSEALFRYLTLLQLIPRLPARISTPVLQEKLAERGYVFELRTLQRDLKDKLSRYFPIICHDQERPFRWSFDRQAQFNLPSLDPASALAFHLAESHLSSLLPQSALAQLNPQFSTARKYLEGLEQNGLAHWARCVRSLPNGKALLPAEVAPPIWEQVSTALLERRQLRVAYLSRSKGESKELRLHPAGLVSRHAISYLIGSANDYDDLRQFALHRIQSAELLDQPAREHQDFDIDRYIEGGAFTWRQDAEDVELIADVHPKLAWLLGETPLSHQQRLEPLPDSDWQRLHARVPLDQETLWWIFGLNDQIRVHAPQVWVEEIGRKLESLQQLYAAAPKSDKSCRSAVEDGNETSGNGSRQYAIQE
jgi:predicted DNA-binding transcriptional regulator YafY